MTKEDNAYLLKWFFLGVILAGMIALGSLFLFRCKRPILPPEEKYNFVPQPTVSESQIQKVGEAVAEYTKKNGKRPEALETLVTEGLLAPADLFDVGRKDAPAINKTTGRFTVTPDVIYFPALTPNDPGNGVLLCTVLLKDKNDPFLVIYNDGQFATLENRELVEALNRTYEQIGKKNTGLSP